MVMANRDIHVFDNEIDQNQTAAVMVVSYTQNYDDLTYNPLPRDIVVHDNRIGKNGWDPQFPGGDVIAKAMGGTMPPVVWDGVTNYTPKGMTAPVAVQRALHRRAGGQPALRRARQCVQRQAAGDARPSTTARSPSRSRWSCPRRKPAYEARCSPRWRRSLCLGAAPAPRRPGAVALKALMAGDARADAGRLSPVHRRRRAPSRTPASRPMR